MKTNYIYPIGIAELIAGVIVYFVAKKYLFGNEQLFTYTPSFDKENVMGKHQKIWLGFGLATFLPVICMLMDEIFAKCSQERIYEIYHLISLQPTLPIMLCLIVLISNVKFGGTIFGDKPHTITRYMVYPAPFELSAIVASLVMAITSVIATTVYVIFANKLNVINVFSGEPTSVTLFVAEIILVVLANYAIIRYFYNTPRELVLGDVAESEYDAVAKRYYGIWRNRLILANLMAGAQLILGGFVTLTNAGEHLMGIRIFGLVILAAVFIYILIQGRDFEDPVVVGGMVYPSEKKRVTLKWVMLSAIALYILGAIILL